MSDTPSQGRRIAFTGKQLPALEPFTPAPPSSTQVLVKTRLTLMSTGTENIVFNRNFDPGTHWDNWVKYPFYPGYSAVGIVEQAGSAVTTLKVGDAVGMRVSHASHHTLEEDKCCLIPACLPLEEAVWFALAKIAFHGARVANYQLGDHALIIGAGPIGQMSIRWARAAATASIVAVDSAAERMALATAGGATAVISQPVDSAREAILAACGGRRPNIVVDTTGNAAVFASALQLVDDFGRLVLLGDTGQPGSQKLTLDVITRGLTIVGAHDMHMTPEWNNHTITALFFRLATQGRFNLRNLNTHTFLPRECAQAYETANRERASTMGLIFDWSE